MANDSFKIGEYFEISNLNVSDDGLITFENTVLPKGEIFIKEMKEKDPSWTEQGYFQKVINDALRSYIDKVEKNVEPNKKSN